MDLTLVCTENITNKKKMKEEKKFPEEKERGQKFPKRSSYVARIWFV